MSRTVKTAAQWLQNRTGRRGFLSRSAMVGGALAVAPGDFVLRPKSAYAAICQCNGSSCTCGSLCCDGYTEFCCTLTGKNQCPSGTKLAGWWKVDGSSFCGGAARYYMDCNAACNGCGCGANGVCEGSCSGTTCGCAKGSCNNRKAGCTRFRYGQCNQQIACVGPIVCRLVTCTPPWTIDATCTTASRTDNATRNHHRPCLATPAGAVESLTGQRGILNLSGWAAPQDGTGTVRIEVKIDGDVVATLQANGRRTDVAGIYPDYGSNRGFSGRVRTKWGRRTVRVDAVDPDSGQRTTLISRVVDLGPTRNGPARPPLRWDRDPAQ